MALSVRIGVGTFDTPGMTRNVEAYDLALQIRNLGLSAQGDTRIEVLSLAQRAVDMDPSSAVLWLMISQKL